MSASTSTNTFQFYHKLLWIVFAAFAIRVAVRLYFGSEDFWVNGYSFFFGFAQDIAAGNGIGFSEADGLSRSAISGFSCLSDVRPQGFSSNRTFSVTDRSRNGFVRRAARARTVWQCRGHHCRYYRGILPLLRGARYCAPGNEFIYFPHHPSGLPAAASASERIGYHGSVRWSRTWDSRADPSQPGAICTVSAAVAGGSRAMPNRVA